MSKNSEATPFNAGAIRQGELVGGEVHAPENRHLALLARYLENGDSNLHQRTAC